jgi:uncharacterized repeat protein (TIGR03803 family)
LHDITNEYGSYCTAKVTIYNNKLYFPFSSSVAGCGSLVEFDLNTNLLKLLHNFESDLSQGNLPEKNIFIINDTIYGTCSGGGTNNLGVIYKFHLLTNTFTKLYDFSSTYGSTPRPPMVYYNNALYGITSGGGTNSKGVIYKLDLMTETYSVLYNFGNITNDGSNTQGYLYLHENKFYGTTYNGGNSNYGIIFEFDPITNNYRKLYDFDLTNGANPRSTVTFYNGHFYGTTYSGGTNSVGVIYSLKVSNTSKINLGSYINKFLDIYATDLYLNNNRITDISNDINLISSNPNEIIPTQYAIKNYIDNNNYFYLNNDKIYQKYTQDIEFNGNLTLNSGLTLKETIITGITNDSGFTLNSDFLLSTQKAIKSYIDYKVSTVTGSSMDLSNYYTKYQVYNTGETYTKNEIEVLVSGHCYSSITYLSGFSYLSGLTDVQISSPLNNQTLVYNGSKWVNSSSTFDTSNFYTKSDINNLIIKKVSNNVTTSSVIDIFTGLTSNGCMWIYNVSDTNNIRTGQIMSAWKSGGTIVFNDITTTSVGTTNSVQFNVTLDINAVSLNTVISTGSTWKIIVTRFEL